MLCCLQFYGGISKIIKNFARTLKVHSHHEYFFICKQARGRKPQFPEAK